jgi:hypothetical protein
VSHPMKRIRLSTVLLLVVILVLGYVSIEAQRREARLRDALASYKIRSQGQIVRTLDEWLPIDWPEGTSLEDAIERIRSRTSTPWLPWPKGVPILVDPDALRRAGKTLKSPVKGLHPDERYTFRQKLRSVLEPMGLAYEVRDGAIIITTPDAIEDPDIEVPEDEGLAP